jgi:hypothetical protein
MAMNAMVKSIVWLLCTCVSLPVLAADCTVEQSRTLANAHLNVLDQAAVAIPKTDKEQSERFTRLEIELSERFMEQGNVPKGWEITETLDFRAWKALSNIDEAKQSVAGMDRLSDSASLKDVIKAAVIVPRKLRAAYDSWQKWYFRDDAPALGQDYSNRITNGFVFGLGATDIFIEDCVDKIP